LVTSRRAVCDPAFAVIHVAAGLQAVDEANHRLARDIRVKRLAGVAIVDGDRHVRGRARRAADFDEGVAAAHEIGAARERDDRQRISRGLRPGGHRPEARGTDGGSGKRL
jgi:hypothetical protein